MEIKKVNDENINEVVSFLESLLVIKDINVSVVFNGSFVVDEDEIIGFLSFEEFNDIGLIRYFVFKKIVPKKVIEELFQRVCENAKEKSINVLITMVVKDDAIKVFKDLGFEIADKNDVYIDEINIKETKFKDAIILKYLLLSETY